MPIGSARLIQKRYRKGISPTHWHLRSGLLWSGCARRASGCEQAELLRRYNRGCEARQVLLYLAATHCRGRYSLSELGLELGPVTVSAIAAARQRVPARAAEDSGLRQRIDAIEETL
ncbi:MAG: hypothetical protein K9N51_09380 [Candidatus Pacebacteria bacterium]|nr:hypothetical protein [Candidatus Paceibacterota bacterium]